ncbi:MAG: hydrogenase expression/formation protein HypE [Candidatus Methanodesulfokora sp.]
MVGKVTLAHGAGGRETEEIVDRLIVRKVPEELRRAMNGVGLDVLDDGASLLIGGAHLVVSVDSYTVKPVSFPGGNIGTLAATGTINDVVMMGARPVAMLDSIVVEEGFDEDLLDEIINSFMEVVKGEKVALIGGDFKVMPKGSVDGIVISTTGIGIAGEDELIVDRVREGDKIVVTGHLGDHGAVILALQQGISLESPSLKSDLRPLTCLLDVFRKFKRKVHAARDPTRGGLAMVLNDWAKQSGNIIVVDGSKIPVREQVSSYAGMLGIDPLFLASEGQAVIAVDSSVCDDFLDELRNLGFQDSSEIGEVRRAEKFRGIVLYKSEVGGHRILEPPSGEIVPRIC